MKQLTPLILIIVSLAAFFFYVQPQYSKIQAYRQEGAEFKDVLAKAEELKTVRAELGDKIKSFSPTDLEKLNTLIPNQVDVARLIVDVSNIAARYGITIDSVETSATGKSEVPEPAGSAPKPYRTVVTGFHFKASYETALQFLKDIERSLRILDVTKINIATGDGQSTIYDFSITIRSYWIDGDSLKIPAAAAKQ